MEPLIPKLDQALRKAYLAYQQTTDGENEASISITLRFTGDIDTAVVSMKVRASSPVNGNLTNGFLHVPTAGGMPMNNS